MSEAHYVVTFLKTKVAQTRLNLKTKMVQLHLDQRDILNIILLKGIKMSSNSTVLSFWFVSAT